MQIDEFGSIEEVLAEIDQLVQERSRYIGPGCEITYSHACIFVRSEIRPSLSEMDDIIGVNWFWGQDRWEIDPGHWNLGLMKAEFQRARFWKIAHYVHMLFPRLQFMFPNIEIEWSAAFICRKCGRSCGSGSQVPEACETCGRFVAYTSGGLMAPDPDYLNRFLFLHKAYGGLGDGSGYQ
jgi:hypothetical protein